MRRFVLLTALLALLATALPSPAGATHDPRHLQARGGRIVDDLGRTVILRAVNVNQLGDYFQGNASVPPVLPISEDDFARIAALGLNTVRLLVHWSALEPQPGVRDDAYLARIREAVGWAGEHGLHVILDMHQDAWGKFVNTSPEDSCPDPLSHQQGWDGAPEWATFTDGLLRCRYDQREISPAVAQAWQSFWIDRPAPDGTGIQQHLVDTWAWLAGEFADDLTVVGYDLLNEPNPGFALDGSGPTALALFHARALAAIRGAERSDLHKLVFFEPLITWNIHGLSVPAPWTLDENIVYAPHVYPDWGLGADYYLQHASIEAQAYRAPLWIGEWGAFGADTSGYAKQFAATEDGYGIGSAFWQWKQACGDPHGIGWPSGSVPPQSGNVVIVGCGDPAQPAGVEIGMAAENVKVLSRPYVRAWPGHATYVSDPDTRTLMVWGVAGDGPLEAWFPGTAAPLYEVDGLGDVTLTAIPGGWIVEAPVTSAMWSLALHPS